jgi:hypothetical protein
MAPHDDVLHSRPQSCLQPCSIGDIHELQCSCAWGLSIRGREQCEEEEYGGANLHVWPLHGLSAVPKRRPRSFTLWLRCLSGRLEQGASESRVRQARRPEFRVQSGKPPTSSKPRPPCKRKTPLCSDVTAGSLEQKTCVSLGHLYIKYRVFSNESVT